MTEILSEFYYGTDRVSEASCATYMFFNRTSITGNISFICLIAIERFVSVLFPLKSKIWITVAKVKKVSRALPPATEWETHPPQTSPPNADIPWADTPLGRHPPGKNCLQQTPRGQTPPSQTPTRTDTPSPMQCMLGYSQQAGGTHPTGMYSC